MQRLIDAKYERDREDLKKWDMLNYGLGQYMIAAFHKPDKYPKKPFLSDKLEDKPRVMSDEEMENKINNLFGKLM